MDGGGTYEEGGEESEGEEEHPWKEVGRKGEGREGREVVGGQVIRAKRTTTVWEKGLDFWTVYFRVDRVSRAEDFRERGEKRFLLGKGS